MNFYRPVPCVSALSFSLRAALSLKDNYRRQFVLRGLAKWASRVVKYRVEGVKVVVGCNTHTHIQITYPILLSWMICGLSIIHSDGTDALCRFVKVKPEWQPSASTIVFMELSQML